MNINARNVSTLLCLTLIGCGTDFVMPNEWEAMSEACKTFGGIYSSLSASGYGKLKVMCKNGMEITVPRAILKEPK